MFWNKLSIIMKYYVFLPAFLAVFLAASLMPPNAFATQFQDQTDADAAYEEALMLISKAQYEQALVKLSFFISDPLKYPKPVSDYIVLLVWTNRFDEAIKSYESLPEGFSKSGYLQRNTAKAYYEKQGLKSAAELYESVLIMTPDDTEALKGLALSLAGLGEYEKAAMQLSILIEKKPADTETRVLYGNILFKAGQYTKAIASFRSASAINGSDAEKIFRHRDALLLSLSEEKKNNLAVQLSIAAHSDKNAAADHIVLLALKGSHSSAVSEFENLGLNRMQSPFDMLNWTAWAYFKTSSLKRAKELYTHVLAAHPANRQALIGLSYCMSAENKSDKALEMLKALNKTYPDDIEIMYANAYAFEQSGEFIKAVNEYDKMIAINPDNKTAKKLRVSALADVGATSLALEEVKKTLPEDKPLIEYIVGNAAVDRLRWAENQQALSILDELLKNPDNRRAQLDYLAALFESLYTAEALKLYESLERQNQDIPAWILEYAAGGYLDQEQPRKALQLYSRALKLEPGSLKARLGIFKTLNILREWDKADAHLSSLEKDFAEPLINGKPNFGKLSFAYERGWFLISQDRLQEAEQYFYNLYTMAPGNTEIRNGLAHAWYHRGWPRLANEEFSIISNLEPEELGYKTGLIMTKNALDQKYEARAEAKELLAKHPENGIVKNLVRDLKVQDMDEITASFDISSEEGGFGDVRYFLSYSHTLTPFTNAYAFLYHARSHENDQKNHFKRVGAGINHIFNSYLSAAQQFSTNYDNAKNFGSLTSITFTPDDYWTFTASFDTYTSDVPFRARVTGISSKKYDLEIRYRVSELSDYSLSLSRYDFSDSNKRDMLNLDHSRQVFLKDDWKMRLFFDLYTSRNSLDDPDYYNPDSDWKFSVTHMTEHVIKKIYRQSWLHRLYLTAGLYKQSGYSGKMDTGARYEHDITFSDTQSLLIGVSFNQNHYDGSPVNSYTFYLTYRGRI